MSSFIYNGPPDRGFEPGATYELTYPAASPDWSPIVTQTSAVPAVDIPATTPTVAPASPSESSKETS